VPVNVSQGFLRQAINRRFHGRGSFAGVRDVDFDAETRAACEAAGEILKGYGQAICGQRWWVRYKRKGTDFSLDFLQGPLAFVDKRQGF